MKKVLVGFFLMSLFSLRCLAMISVPMSFYNKQADIFFSNFDFSDLKFKQNVCNYMNARIKGCTSAMSIENGEVVVLNDALFALEASSASSQVISSFLLEVIKKERVVSEQQPAKEKCGLKAIGIGTFFMLDFATFVEKNVLHMLQMNLGLYFGDQLEDFEQELGLTQIPEDRFYEIIQKKYTQEVLKVLTVLESKRFALIVCEKLKLMK